MHTKLWLAALIATGTLTSFARAQTAERRTVTLEGAHRAIAAVVNEALRRKVGAVVAVVDDGGNLVALERVDGTFAAGAHVSAGKARTAVLFKKPTRFFEELINKGRTAMTAVEDFTPLIGGIPILIDGQVVGGIGVSGASSAKEDEELAFIGAATLMSKDAHASTSWRFEQSHRDAAGQAEVHTRDTDVIYVVEGSATLVTGGSVVDAKATASDELRGSAIKGGETRHLGKGDLLVVPHGVPHWFAMVPGPIDYYVVKVRS
jgi:glc operon protein GlcG